MPVLLKQNRGFVFKAKTKSKVPFSFSRAALAQQVADRNAQALARSARSLMQDSLLRPRSAEDERTTTLYHDGLTALLQLLACVSSRLLYQTFTMWYNIIRLTSLLRPFRFDSHSPCHYS